MSQLTLWVMPASPPSWATRMLGEILGLEFKLNNMDFVALEHKTPEFLKINPMGTIPALKDGDFIVSESHTMMKYLLEKYGKKDQIESLYPIDLRARALVDQAMYFDTGVAFIRVKLVALPAIFEGAQGLTPEVTKKVEEAYSIVEAYLGRSRYVAAEHLTLADLSLGSTILSLASVVTLDADKYPRTVSWLNKLKQETFFKNVAVPGAAILANVISSAWEENKKK